MCVIKLLQNGGGCVKSSYKIRGRTILPIYSTNIRRFWKQLHYVSLIKIEAGHFLALVMRSTSLLLQSINLAVTLLLSALVALYMSGESSTYNPRNRITSP